MWSLQRPCIDFPHHSTNVHETKVRRDRVFLKSRISGEEKSPDDFRSTGLRAFSRCPAKSKSAAPTEQDKTQKAHAGQHQCGRFGDDVQADVVVRSVNRLAAGALQLDHIRPDRCRHIGAREALGDYSSWREWHCRLMRKDLRCEVYSAAARTLGGALCRVGRRRRFC